MWAANGGQPGDSRTNRRLTSVHATSCAWSGRRSPIPAGVTGLDCGNEVDDLVRRDRAHDVDLEGGPLQPPLVLGQLLGGLGPLVHLAQMRLQHAPQLGGMRVATLAVEQRSSHLALSGLDASKAQS